MIVQQADAMIARKLNSYHRIKEESSDMRSVKTEEITRQIREMCIEANHFLSSDMKEVFDQAVKKEESPLGRQILNQLEENLKIAGEDMIPICQDTGMAVILPAPCTAQPPSRTQPQTRTRPHRVRRSPARTPTHPAASLRQTATAPPAAKQVFHNLSTDFSTFSPVFHSGFLSPWLSLRETG